MVGAIPNVSLHCLTRAAKENEMEQSINKLPFLGNANAGSEVDVTRSLHNHTLGPVIGHQAHRPWTLQLYVSGFMHRVEER